MEKNRILHVCLACFYYDKMSYQENMLVKKHLEMGNEVRVVSFCDDMVDGRKIIRAPGLYQGQFGELIYRLQTLKVKGVKKLNPFFRLSNYHSGLSEILEEYSPHIIFVHGPQTKNVYDIIDYKKRNQKVAVYADNHTDKINSRRGGNLLKCLVRNFVYGKYARDLSRVTEKFWGTTPARCDFLKNTYHVNKNKIDFLPTGVDENKINEQGKAAGRQLLQKFGVADQSFIIVSGGKFDSYKNLIPLIDSFVELSKKYTNLSLVLFGTLDKKYEDYMQNKNVTFLGWLDGTSIINVLMNADLSVFIGGHSTMWEESIAIGLPGIFMKYKGFQHINFNENVIFIEKNKKEIIMPIIASLLSNKEKYETMKKNALSDGRKKFYYSEIAKKAIC